MPLATPFDGYKLLQMGVETLSEIESNGIHVDLSYAKDALERVKARLEDSIEEFYETDLGDAWDTTYKWNMDIDSTEQLRHVVYNVMGAKVLKKTDSQLPSCDAEALRAMPIKGCAELINIRKLQKVANTYLKNIIAECHDGFLHPSFNLHLARTYRSSSQDPNFQNLPIRDKEMGSIIRQCLIPRKGHYFVEIDYSGVEVRIACCYHNDKTMKSYIKDPTKDMHQDMADQIFILGQGEASKDARYVAKNRYTFPTFYGSFSGLIAPDIWKGIDDLELKDPKGNDIRQHLKKNGISNQKDFLDHIKTIEDHFWDVRFP